MGRVLVTGAAGFIGSHLCERLLEEGEEVVGVDCFTDYYDPGLKRRNITRLLRDSRFSLIEADLRLVPLEPILADVEAVFHQAAQAGVRSSWGRGFSEYSSINVDATQRLLTACGGIEGRLTRFVYASSSSVYGDAPSYPTAEDDPKLPVSPYGVTKLAGELLVRLHAVNYGLPATSLRYFTVYGPRQRPDMGFHRFLSAIERGEPLTVFGDGDQTRDFTYVSDAVEANILAWRAASEPGAVFNVGGGSRVSISHVIAMMEHLSGRKANVVHAPASAGDVRHTGADTTRARQLLGYAPRCGLEEGLALMRAWMVRYLTGEGE
jgi:nucleoside-diphosphate-sugar epimerase